MRCRTARRRLSDGLDGALPASRQAGLAAHLQACAACRAYQLRIRVLQERSGLAAVRSEASWAAFEADLEAKMDSAAERRPRQATAPVVRRRLTWAWVTAAASILIGLAGWAALQRQARVPVETWTAYADVLDPLLMAAEEDRELAGRLAREVGAQIEEQTPAPDTEALLLPAADPLFWEGLSDDELRGIIAELEDQTAHGGPA
jgi:anti-sigma factor RsiW